ncbi:MAG: hypothetical protein HQ513_01300 [Rhodospirillales bacterium]|nr:hypothetical protein [Rhodospirillales bacterium]
MKFSATIFLGVFTVALLTGGTLVGFSDRVFAGNSEKTKEADTIRRRAQARAKRNLGYPDIFDYVARENTEQSDSFYFLSRQIEQLSRYLKDVSRSLNRGLPGSVGAIGDPDDVKTVYGPDGPTVKSVRLILEYRLMVAGNPRLKPGPVTDTGTSIRAGVVTADGSVVEEFDINKKTGEWRAVRN